jgi:hypothetical protein
LRTLVLNEHASSRRTRRPTELIKRGIYSEIRLKGSPWRESSMALLRMTVGSAHLAQEILTYKGADDNRTISAVLGMSSTMVQLGANSIAQTGAMVSETSVHISALTWKTLSHASVTPRGRSQIRHRGVVDRPAATPSFEDVSCTGEFEMYDAS